jgi:adenine-specific DNA methylase
VRDPWWVVPSPWVPDLFLLRQIYEYPRLIQNNAAATCTDTIHRVRLTSEVDAGLLAAASINSLTFAFAEVMGRSYGGGVLELEPGEAEKLPFPDPTGLSKSDVKEVDRLVRSHQIERALDIVDAALLCERMALTQKTVAELRTVWTVLKDRRLRRGRRSLSALKRAA